MSDNIDHSDDTMADGGTDSFTVPAGDVNDASRTRTDSPDETGLAGPPEPRREFMLETIRRVPLLRTLQGGSADATTLSESVDMSRSTVHRAINSLEEYDVVRKSDGEYHLTTLGEVIARETEAYTTRTWTTVTLKQFLNAVELERSDFPVSHFTNAEITRRTARQPHATIHRIIKLIERSDSLRMLSTVISPVYVDVGYREMMNGMEIEAIFEREVLDLMLAQFPEKANETIETGNFDVYAHDALPFELFIFGDKIGMAAHNENGNAEVLVECDDAEAIEWAEELYAEHRSQADPLSLSE